MIHQTLFDEMASRNETLRMLAVSDSSTRAKMIRKPEVKDLLNIPIPYVVENVPLIVEGVHNGDFYPADILREAVPQHEGLQIFADHHNNFMGGTIETFRGIIKNPKWNENLKGVVGDVHFLNLESARAVAYGAKWGLSCTVDCDVRSDPSTGKRVVFSPVFRSYSLVLDPACRETMLNEKKHIGGSMEENGITSDLASEFAGRLADSLVAKYGMEAAQLLMVGKKKEYPEVYGYPEKKKKIEDESEKLSSELAAAAEAKKSLEAKLAELEAGMKKLSGDLDSAKAENTKLSLEISAFKAKELGAEISLVLDKEKTLGLLQGDGISQRLEELKKLSSQEITAISKQLDSILKATESADATPSELGMATQPSEHKQLERAHTAQELDAIRDGTARKLLGMMQQAQR